MPAPTSALPRSVHLFGSPFASLVGVAARSMVRCTVPTMGSRSVSHAVRPLVLAVLAGGLVAVGPQQVSTAHACSCMNPLEMLDEMMASSDAVFVGTVVEIRRPEIAMSSMAESRFVFEVEQVFQGSVRELQSIVTASDGASCGIELSRGATALVFAREKGFDVTPDAGEFESSLCGVVAEPSAAALAPLGEGRAPTPGASPIGADDGIASTVARNWLWMVVVLVGVAFVSFRLTRRSIRSTPTD
ncbi:unannotated protein [freshwater metagenome]|uniref:Unannotated protein n=1 Tax=freshwater metagenome TaxID=449393 RepID=A0A6J6DCX6_9ZZZZ